MKFDNENDYLEWIAITYGIIKAFELRGYGLYELGRGPVMFTSIEMIMEFVQYGRTEDVLKVGIRYLPLPLLKDSTDVLQMQKAIEEMARQLRGPFFTDILPEKNKVHSHLIDSVVVEPPFLNLNTDVRFAQVTTENTIEIHLSEAARIIKRQLMMSLRTVFAPGGKQSGLL